MSESNKSNANRWNDFDEAVTRGFCVIPGRVGTKSPLVYWTDFQERKPGNSEIEAWKKEFINPNTIVITGQISDIVVLECDSQAGFDYLQSKGLPKTFTIKSPGGSHNYHYYFHYPKGFDYVRGFVKGYAKELPDVDLKADGGYVVFAGSVHPNNGTYSIYRNEEIAEAPEWLTAYVREHQRKVAEQAKVLYNQVAPQANSKNSNNNYAFGALKNRSASVARAIVGTRNDALFDAAISLSPFVREGLLSESEVIAELESAAQKCGLLAEADGRRKVLATIRSGLSKGHSFDTGYNASFGQVPNKQPDKAPPKSKQDTPSVARERRRYKLSDLRDEDLPQLKWVIADLLPEGLCIMAAKPKIGKSWLALQMAIAVSSGGHVFGDRQVEQGDVLYVALEDNRRRMLDRRKKLLPDSSQAKLNRLEIDHDFPKLGEGCELELETWLQEHPNARLVIIDTLKKVRPARKGNRNAYDDDYSDMEPLQRLALLHHVAIVVVHHVKKVRSEDPFDNISGTLGLSGGADTLWVITRDRKKSKGELYVVGREVDEQALELRFDMNLATWAIVGDLDDEDDSTRVSPERKQLEEVVVRLAKSLGRAVKPSDVYPCLPNKNEEAIRRLLWKMGNDGELIKVADGGYLPPLIDRDHNGNDDYSSHNGHNSLVERLSDILGIGTLANSTLS